MHRGYVKLWRMSLESGLLQNAEAWQLMTWCLLRATHKSRKQVVGKQFVILEPGQFVFGRKKATQELRTSEQKIRTSLKLLESVDFLTIKSTNKYSVITVVNWGIYQQDQPANNQPPNQQSTNNQPTINHKQTCKELKACEEEKTLCDESHDEPFYLTAKKKKLTGKRLEAFEEFWVAFDYKKGKAPAADSWLAMPELKPSIVALIVKAAETEAKNRPDMVADGKTPKMAQGWLTERRWEDEAQGTPQPKMSFSQAAQGERCKEIG